MSQNRYDALRTKIARDFARAKTFTPAISDGGGSEQIFDLNDPENVGNDRFLKFGPFNYVRVQNFSGSAVRVYFDKAQTLYTEVDGVTGRGNKGNREVSAEIPVAYVSYLRIENLAASSDGTGDIADGELLVQVGNEADSVALDLLKMGGQLNVEG